MARAKTIGRPSTETPCNVDGMSAAQKTHMGLRHLVTQNPTDILALVPKLAVCGASGSSFTAALQYVDCVECLYEIAWIAIDRARKLGNE